MRGRIVAGAAALLLTATLLHAQTTASVSGTVTFEGQPMAGAKVTATSPALQGSRTAISGEDGTYRFEALPPGDYTLQFKHPETTYEGRSVRVELARTARVDVELTLISERLVIAADLPTSIEVPEISTNLRLRDVEKLPVQRNQLATVQLAPGVLGNIPANGELQISGGPGYDNLVLVNGVVVTENTRGQIRPMYVEDAIQETTVLTGAISAEYGRFTGGVVNTITRSGGNALSGSLRDSLTSPTWSAQTPAKEQREDTLNHVWEETLGGYILRDRLWFFHSGRWAKNDTSRQTVPVPAFNGNPSTPASTPISYSEGNDQKRYEGKLTASFGPNHSLVGSYFRIDTKGTNSRFGNAIYDTASFTTRDEPESLIAAHYIGTFAPSLLAEGQYSNRRFSSTTGGLNPDLVGGTVLLDRSNGNARFGTASQCGVCDPERRNNDDVLVKATYALNGARAGTHLLSAGADRFHERREPNNHQSASDFLLFVTRAQYKDGAIYPVVTPTTAAGGGTFIRWAPILAAARENDLRTDSLFVNDAVDFGTHWSATLGFRWDRNHAADADGNVSSDDHRISPRLAVQFDPFGNGRQQAIASYSVYATRIADNIASSNQTAGNATVIDFAYKGPAINDKALNAPLPDVLRAVFDSFNNRQGGTGNTAADNLRSGGNRSVPGYATYFDGSLASPYVRELTLGYGMEIGKIGYVRADLVHRDWRDLYTASVTTATRRTTTPLGIPVDLALYRNSPNLQRSYRGVQLQLRTIPGRPFDAGVYYTWSKLRGNDDSDTAQGPVAVADPSLFYPEYLDYERFSPAGYLSSDQRHRVRAWIGLAIDQWSVSVLHSYDSALPYSAVGPINVTRYAGAPANPGYNAIPNGQYFFSGRGQYRADDVSATSLALRYGHVVGKAELFVQGDLLNAFNHKAVADPARVGTTVSTAATSSTFAPFDPAKQTPVECPRGAAADTCRAMNANYQLATNFGQPLNEQAYQQPRTYRFSVGARF